jgi:hypothetical protein
VSSTDVLKQAQQIKLAARRTRKGATPSQFNALTTKACPIAAQDGGLRPVHGPSVRASG